nr:hypothetical protein [uncultured Roseococcus sp.]
MTDLRAVAGLDIEINNKASEGAAAAARDLEKVEAAADKAAAALKEAEVGTRLVGDTFEKTAARVDVLARAEQRRAEITARAERETAALTAAAEREGRSADELAAALAAVSLRRDADIAKAQRQAETQRAQQLALTGGLSEQSQAMMASAAAADRYAAGLTSMAEAARRAAQVQEVVNRFAGVRSVDDYSSRAADIAAYGVELDRLRSRYDPLFAAQQRYRADLSDLRNALATGAIAEATYTARLEERKAAFAEQAQGLGLMSRAHREAAAAAAHNADIQSQVAARIEATAAAAQKASSYQAGINQTLGVSQSGGYGERAAEIAAYGVELDRLRAKYNPLFAAQQQYRASLAEIASAERVGALASREAAAAKEATKMAFANQVREINGMGSASEQASGKMSKFALGVQQSSYQLQDFVVQVGSGQSALVALGQQGPQLLSVFGAGGAFAGLVLAVVAMGAALLTGKSAAQELRDAIEGIERSSQSAIQEADRMESALRRQNSQFLSGAAAGDRYRQGLQGMGEELVRLARYYERLTEAQRAAEGVSLNLQRRALTAGSGELQRDILRPLQGRIVTAEGGAAVDLSGMAGGIAQGGTSIENVPQELRALTQDAIRWRDAGRITAEGVQSLINSVATAKAGSTEYRAELEAYERQLLGMLPRIREYEEAMRRVGVAETALNPANAAQVALEGMRGVTSEVGGNYQARQRILEQRRLLQAGLASGLATPEDRAAGRSSLQQLAQQEQGLTPATQQQLRALQEQVTISRAAEGAARDLAQAEMDLDRAARGAGLGQASAAEKAEARRLVQERLNETLATNMVTLNRQITGEQAIANAYSRSAQEGRLMEAAVRAQAEALKYGAEGSAEYERALVTLTTRYDEMAGVQAQRQLSQRNLQSQNELEYLQREAQLIGASADARERELAALRARQQAGAAAGSDAAKEAERLAVQLVDTRRTTDQLRNSWNDLATFGENAFSKIGDAITQGFAQGQIQAIRFKDIAKAALSEVVQAAMKLAVINPLLNSVFGGTRGTLGGIMQVGGMGGLGSLGLGGGQQIVAAADGSLRLAGNQAGQAAGISSLGRVSGLSGIMSYGGLSNTGWAGVDGFLNTQAWGVGGGVTDAASLGNAGGTLGGPTYGNLLGGGLGMAAGLYGIYSGIQRGGIGGFTTAAGGALGAAAGLSTMTGIGASLLGGPAAPIIAAVLAIAGSLLPGQKPSGKGQEFRYDLGSGDVERNGLGGNRYSAENASQAELATRGIVDLANRLGQRLGGIRNDGQVAVGVTSSRGNGPGTLYLEVNNQRAQFSNDEDGAKQLADRAAELLIGQLRDRAQGDYRNILNASGNSVEKLDENLTWYETTYKSLTGAADATSAFGQQLKALTDQWQPAIDKAHELGLATARLNERRDEEIAKLYAQRDLQVRGFDLGLDLRAAQAAGGANAMAGAGTAQQAALLQFDLQAAQQIAAARETLEGLGLASDEVTWRIARNEQVLGQERLAIIEQVAAAQRQLYEGAVSADQDWVIRAKRSEGDGLGADLIEFDRQSRAAVEQSKTTWQAAGMAAEDIAARMVWVEQALGRERLAIVERYAEQARAAEQQAAQSAASVISSLADYARGLAYSDKSALSVQDQYGLALSQYNAVSGAALAGDANSLGQLRDYTETLLGAGRAMFGSGAEYAALFDRATDVLKAVGNLSPDTLTASFQAEIIRTQTSVLGSKLDAIETAIQQLRTVWAQSGNAPARAAAA